MRLRPTITIKGALLTTTICIYLWAANVALLTHGAIVPPPWGDPSKNPCAALPGGWQLLYWAPLNECFKIFQVGFPCPDTMELSPVGIENIRTNGSTAECRCPPGTAQSILTSQCHKLFTRGPCEAGQYFAPRADSPGRSPIPKKRWGLCKEPDQCMDGMVFWPQDGKCYTEYSRGPCPKGKLLALDEEGVAECLCKNNDKLQIGKYYHRETETCHEYYTKGPCDGDGDLFLPNGKCGCHSALPHYHKENDQCYELGSVGPCPVGHIFALSENTVKGKYAQAECQCKEDHVLWRDGYCYRQYTRGPCEENEFITSTSTCLPNPCPKGRLYFPQEKTCYRIGSQGPCALYQVVVFDFTSRPSIDGISYNGVCGCAGILTNLDQTCNDRVPNESACESNPGMVEINGECFKLYTRGPCGPGEWLEPVRHQTNRIRVRGKCECKPDYAPYTTETGLRGCQAPSVGIARYLNGFTVTGTNSTSITTSGGLEHRLGKRLPAFLTARRYRSNRSRMAV